MPNDKRRGIKTNWSSYMGILGLCWSHIIFKVFIPIPSPNSTIITDTNQHFTVPAKRCLPDGRCTLRMSKDARAYLARITDINIKYVCFTTFIPNGNRFLTKIKAESYEPNVTILDIKSVYHAENTEQIWRCSIFRLYTIN